ncbi:hypothetical protein K466DRAFT_484937 [Polyporus arcularius HHB13444]|uniref:Uncharacterized protein n=1 Tax=Polyporus arcularius HHB13444 TaxID=1314778 RepID=A0A5C3PLA8_9APHY|nr:hypothetical protein K466DRAFT_484937 [Polyporus arcularius HHB13444]
MPSATPSRYVYTSSGSYSHAPLLSSPLASPTSSPAANASARRRSQYKANAFSSPADRRSSGAYGKRRHSSDTFVQGSSTQATSAPSSEEPPRKAFLKERLQARCIERAQKKRERAIARGSRHLSSDASSDGLDELMDEDDEDEEVMLNDSFFQRIVESAKRKERHQYRLSFAQDVGSSFDPDMEDPAEWETELRGGPISTTPDDLLAEELEAYAAEAELNLDDLDVNEIFSLSDFEDDDVDMQ